MANEKKKFLEDLEESDVEKDKPRRKRLMKKKKKNPLPQKKSLMMSSTPMTLMTMSRRKDSWRRRFLQRGRLQQAGGGAEPSICQLH